MIKELTLEEAAQLRELVKNRFQQGHFNGSGFRITQYKEAYQALADDIQHSVKGDAASISTHRLRKLFFYTDPAICPGERLEKPSFGDDFIRVLFVYVATLPDIVKNGEPKPQEPRVQISEIFQPKEQTTKVLSSKWVWRTIAIVLFIILSWMGWKYLEQPAYWTEEFNSVSVDSLKSRGWEILDYDSVAFSKQLKPGCFTAYTLRGDYWYTQPDSPIITNLLLKEINSKSAKITLKIDDFNPTQEFQQAGIVLLDKNRNKEHNIRITVNSCSSGPRFHQAIQIVKRENGTAYETPTFIIWSWDTPAPPDSSFISPIWIQIQCEKNKFHFYYHFGEEYASFRAVNTIDFNFEPAFVAIGAFRGIRNSKRDLNNSESIPAFFDYLKVEPMPE
jgi:hypothetical protein